MALMQPAVMPKNNLGTLPPGVNINPYGGSLQQPTQPAPNTNPLNIPSAPLPKEGPQPIQPPPQSLTGGSSSMHVATAPPSSTQSTNPYGQSDAWRNMDPNSNIDPRTGQQFDPANYNAWEVNPAQRAILAARFGENPHRYGEPNSAGIRGRLDDLIHAWSTRFQGGAINIPVEEFIDRELRMGTPYAYGGTYGQPSSEPDPYSLNSQAKPDQLPTTGAPPTGGSRSRGPDSTGTTGPRTDPTTLRTTTDGPGPNSWNSWNNRTRDWRVPDGYSIDAGQIPGLTGDLGNYNDYNDMFAGWLSQLGSTYQDQFGRGIGGNSIGPDGQWNMPPELRGLMERYAGANTDPRMRNVTGDQLVQNRLAGLMREDNELNQIAVSNAREEAAARGMLGSGVAEGAALRASREAMLPIAQQDAQTYSQADRDDQNAFNQDALADQSNRTGLLGQEYGTAAQLLDSATDRRWRSSEALTERAYRTMENELGFRRGALDREDQQDFVATQQRMQNDFARTMQEMQNNWQGDQNDLNRTQERLGAFYNHVFGREGMMSNLLASIYSNPNLTPEQQQRAAQNMQAIMTSLFESFNATLGQGIPDIFTNPYPINRRRGG